MSASLSFRLSLLVHLVVLRDHVDCPHSPEAASLSGNPHAATRTQGAPQIPAAGNECPLVKMPSLPRAPHSFHPAILAVFARVLEDGVRVLPHCYVMQRVPRTHPAPRHPPTLLPPAPVLLPRKGPWQLQGLPPSPQQEAVGTWEHGVNLYSTAQILKGPQDPKQSCAALGLCFWGALLQSSRVLLSWLATISAHVQAWRQRDPWERESWSRGLCPTLVHTQGS